MESNNDAFIEYLKEAVGTFILVMLGNGVVANVRLAPQLSAQAYNWNTIAIGWGLAYTVAIFLSAGHLNPAVTLALACKRNFPWRKVFPYILAQFVGAFLGSAGLWFMYKDGLAPAGFPNIWATGAGSVYRTAFTGGPGAEVSGSFRVIVASVAELFGTILLVWGILAVGELKKTNLKKVFGAILIGFTVLGIGLSLGGPSGFAINPARDLAPRLFGALVGTAGLFDGLYWLVPPVLIPLFAGPLGIILYDLLIQKSSSHTIYSVLEKKEEVGQEK